MNAKKEEKMAHVSINDIIWNANRMSPTEYFDWCETIEEVTNKEYKGYPFIKMGIHTMYGIEAPVWKMGRLTGIQELGAYVIGFYILIAKSNGQMWGVCFPDILEEWFQYPPILPEETGRFLFNRVFPI